MSIDLCYNCGKELSEKEKYTCEECTEKQCEGCCEFFEEKIKEKCVKCGYCLNCKKEGCYGKHCFESKCELCGDFNCKTNHEEYEKNRCGYCCCVGCKDPYCGYECDYCGYTNCKDQYCKYK